MKDEARPKLIRLFLGSSLSMFTVTQNVAPLYTSPTKWERSARSAGRGCLRSQYDWINPLPHRCCDATSPTSWVRSTLSGQPENAPGKLISQIVAGKLGQYE
jgi:hypothetical protein